MSRLGVVELLDDPVGPDSSGVTPDQLTVTVPLGSVDGSGPERVKFPPHAAMSGVFMPAS